MNKKILILFLVILVGALGLSLNFVLAKNQSNSGDQMLPEQAGTYDVAGRPDLKLKVFVHNPKPEKQDAKPAPTPSPVCNLLDPDSATIVGDAGWHLPDGTWNYVLNTSSVPSTVGSQNLATMATYAFNRWSSATGNKVVFINGGGSTVTRAVLDGKNIITWGRTSGTALAVTYIWYDKNTGIASEVDTIMNNKFSWSWSNPASWTSPATTCASASSYDAQDILTHELGHWVGLNDFYTADYQNATMFGYGAKAEIKKDTLSTGDISGVGIIYLK